MIPLAQAIPQVLRFSGCPGWPETKEGQLELANTMAEISTDPAHAERIADAWRDQNFAVKGKEVRWAPTPHDLTQMARWTAPPTPATDEPPCSECDGSGWVLLPERQIHGDSYSSVEPCACRQGISS